MTKIDFAIHLFRVSRDLTREQSQRVPVVALLVMLELSKREPGTWHRGDVLAEAIGGSIAANTIASSCRGSIAAGLLERRASTIGGRYPSNEWQLPPAGQRAVERLLKTPTPAAAAHV